MAASPRISPATILPSTARASMCAVGLHTNTVAGFHGVFKRGMKGVYQHCSEKHLHC